MNVKRLLQSVFIVFSRCVFSLIYDRKYLTGKWFDEATGWKWCWRFFWQQKVMGYNRSIPFPVNPSTTVGAIENLTFDISNMDNFWKWGSYFQCWNGRISIGRGTWIAQGVGIITENHDPMNLEKHLPSKDVSIGEDCWIGMNAVILPGVSLGNRTIVGAGSVVTKSFEEGYCVIAGVPARIIRRLPKEGSAQ